MLNNIPAELRVLPQWVCAGPDKRPLTPGTGKPADVTDRTTWGTFESACASGYQNIGFVLTEQDPYTIIDLDVYAAESAEQVDRMHKIAQAFESYTERSQSGQGFHVIIKGHVPHGARRDHVEVYSAQRYMICTGNAVNTYPIRAAQDLLDTLYREMTPVSGLLELDEHEGTLDDAQVFEAAMRASNAEKFDRLCKGEMSEYPSQSEADFALMNILAFYTRDNEQCRRLFRMSALGKREKALRNDKHLDRCLMKIRAEQPAPVDFAQLQRPPAPTSPQHQQPAPTPAQPQQSAPQAAPAEDVVLESGLPLPPGLIGETARYIYASSVRPVPEVAFAGALAFLSGIAGRAFNISGTGLNHYIVLLASTGVGKEGAARGVDKLVNSIRPKVPAVADFVGPGVFASGQALLKWLSENPCFLSILGEFGLTLQQICDPRANGAEVMLRRVLLDVFSKSGWDSTLQATVYSDKEKNTKIVHAPNLTILGESTPETFYGGLDTSHVEEGLIPRFTVIEYLGKRPPRNKRANVVPPDILVEGLSQLAVCALSSAANHTCTQVQVDPDAQRLMDDFDVKVDAKINRSGEGPLKQIWNRAHLKALKLAGLVAVGTHPYQPIVTVDIAKWAVDFVEYDAAAMLNRFSTGGVGTGDAALRKEIMSVVESFLGTNKPPKAVPRIMHQHGVIPYSYLMTSTAPRKVFKNDRRGATGALKQMLEEMVSADILQEVPRQQMSERYGTRSRAFVLPTKTLGQSNEN